MSLIYRCKSSYKSNRYALPGHRVLNPAPGSSTDLAFGWDLAGFNVAAKARGRSTNRQPHGNATKNVDLLGGRRAGCSRAEQVCQQSISSWD
jgi:hypothetical protein